MQRTNTHLVWLVAAAAGLAGAGCLALDVQTTVRETPGEFNSREGRLPGRQGALVARLQGTTLNVQVRTEATCFHESYRAIHRTEVQTREIASSGFTWYVMEWGCGVACTIGGIVSLVLAPGMSDETGGTDSESSQMSDQTYAYIGGAGGVGLGVGTLIAAIVETVRATDDERQLTDTEDVTGRETQPCDIQPSPNTPVEGLIAGRTVSLGVTGSNGTLSVDLRRVLPASLLHGMTPPIQLGLRIAGSDVGTVDLAEYLAAVDSAAWGAAQSANTTASLQLYLADQPHGSYRAEAASRLDEMGWMAAMGEDSASAYEAYLTSFPQGLHTADARQRADDLTWSEVSAVDDVEGFDRYLAVLPNGSHAVEARTRIVQLLVDAKALSEAEERITAFLQEDPRFAPEADRLQGLVDDQRAQAARRIDRAIADAGRIAGRCTGGGAGTDDVRVAGEAYRKLFSVRREAPASRTQQAISDIMARCGACSPDCAGVR